MGVFPVAPDAFVRHVLVKDQKKIRQNERLLVDDRRCRWPPPLSLVSVAAGYTGGQFGWFGPPGCHTCRTHKFLARHSQQISATSPRICCWWFVRRCVSSPPTRIL